MPKSSVRRATLAVLFGLVACLAFAPGAWGDRRASETALNPSGTALEINPDAQGLLWITDLDAGQVWGLDPDGGSYEVYTVLGSPSDARHAEGWLWWADAQTNILGRVSTSDGAYTRWEVLGATGFYGTAVDAQGRLWATAADAAYVYRLDPAQANVCRFALPSDARSNYILRDGGFLWLADRVNGRLLRLAVSDNNLRGWSLPAQSRPLAMAMDEQGSLWYTDTGLNVLARLEPAANRLTSYALPGEMIPAMVTVRGEQIWYTEYTEQGQGSIGRLAPHVAGHTIVTLPIESTDLTAVCSSISPASTGFVTITTGDLDWSPATYPTIMEQDGWGIYQLPEGSHPWGIAGTGQTAWMVDSGRQVLARFITKGDGRTLYLPLLLR